MGLTNEKVELEHLRTIVKEMDREIQVMESIRADNQMLKDQIARQDEKYSSLEATRTELENTKDEQQRQITQLQQLVSQEKSHNDVLLK